MIALRVYDTAKDAGYEMCEDVIPGDGYLLVPVGEYACEEDEFWAGGKGPWTILDPNVSAHQTTLGATISIFHVPIRRKNPDFIPYKWSCRAKYVGHRRLPEDKFCKICSALYNRWITE